MEHFIKNLEIQNFKSIKHLTLEPKRINVFIGKPNVGKSNILEALGLFSIQYAKKLSDLIRFEILHNVFIDNDLSNTIGVIINNSIALELRFPDDKNHDFPFRVVAYDAKNANNFPLLDARLEKSGQQDLVIEDYTQGYFPFKYYQFRDFDFKEWNLKNYLFPPFGNNLFEVVTSHKSLREDTTTLLKQYSLDFVASVSDRKFLVQKNENGFVTQFPYSSIADTFQRFIFYLAAIESNQNSVLIFEEPEVHSFPPYVRELAERMILKDDNQYFVSTHSRYMLNTFIDSLDHTQLNVYLTYYRDYQTHVRALTPDELRDVQDFGYDVFFNLRKFEPNE